MVPAPGSKRAPTATPKTADFEIGGERIRAGGRRTVELPVARLQSGTMMSMPTVVVHGATPGPTVWLSSCIHGDELNGIPIIRRVLAELKKTELSGTLITVPIVNVFGLVNESRYLPDRRDLNRSFPGSKRGSLASQMARIFMDEVVERCDGGIDLHTGSGGRSNLPQIRCDVDDERTLRAARRFGAPVILHAALRDGSLRAAARERGARVLLYEAGEALRFDQEAIMRGTEGVLRVLHDLAMIPRVVPAPQKKSIVCRESNWVRSRRSGFFELAVRLGDRVKQGALLGTVHDAVGTSESEIRSPHAGVVIGALVAATVHRGNAVAHIADTAR